MKTIIYSRHTGDFAGPGCQHLMLAEEPATSVGLILARCAELKASHFRFRGEASGWSLADLTVCREAQLRAISVRLNG